MATTAGGTPYVESSDLVANYPAVSLALAEHIDDLPATVLQVVRATDVTQRLTTSTSFVDANISVTITPQKSTSAILIIHSAQTNMGSGVRVETQITDSSNIAISGAENTDSAGGRALFTALAWATPATTSATTYKARFRSSNGGSALLENATNTGQMYAIEVSA
jgi:hypothetical protein